MKRAVALIMAVLAVVGCTGTFTPATPTLYLVVLDAGGGLPARVALLAFEATPTERSLEMLTPTAYAFDPGEDPVAIDVRDRDDRTEAWILTAIGGGRGVRLHRLDLRAVADEPGTLIAAAEPPRTLTDADGAWVGFGDATFPTGCLAGLVVAADGTRMALWDAGTDARCGDVAGAFPQVHVLDLVDDTVRDTLLDVFAPGVAPAEPGDADGLLLIERPVGSLDARQVTPVTFDAPRPDLGAPTTVVEGLLDVVGVPGGFATLRSTGGTDRLVGVVLDGVAAEQAAPNGATALHADPTGRLGNLLTTGAGRLGVTYPGEPTLRELSFDANDLTIEPLNAYALAVRLSGGLCLVDLLVPSTSPACDLNIAPALGAALPAPRFVTWTFAEPVAP